MENFCNFSEHLQIFEVATCNSTSEVATVNAAIFFVVENFPATCNYLLKKIILNICWWPMCSSSSENC